MKRGKQTRPRVGVCRFEVYTWHVDYCRGGQNAVEFLGGSSRLRDVVKIARRESGVRWIAAIYDRRRDVYLGGYINGARDRTGATWR